MTYPSSMRWNFEVCGDQSKAAVAESKIVSSQPCRQLSQLGPKSELPESDPWEEDEDATEDEDEAKDDFGKHILDCSRDRQRKRERWIGREKERERQLML